jgi:hypothetical protein
MDPHIPNDGFATEVLHLICPEIDSSFHAHFLLLAIDRKMLRIKCFGYSVGSIAAFLFLR